jgi:hypothetical protein
MTAENAEKMAAMQAKYEVQGRYGRGAQSRVANVLRPQEGPHNLVAKEQKALQQKYRLQYLRKINKITNSDKIGLLEFAKKLQLKVKQHTQFGGAYNDRYNERNNNRNKSIVLEVPFAIAKILLFAIGVALLVFAIGASIADTLFLGNSGIGSAISMSAYGLMGLSGESSTSDDDY